MDREETRIELNSVGEGKEKRENGKVQLTLKAFLNTTRNTTNVKAC